MSSPKDPAASYAGKRLRQEVLDGADLRDADFARASLDQVSLRGADLRGACLCGADLSQVDLSEARLDGADLRGASLERVVLDKAVLHDVDARGVSIVQSSLEQVSARGINLGGAGLVKLSLVKVELEDCVLDGASLDDVGVVDCTLRGCSLVGLRATGCSITGGCLEGCDLSGASIDDGELRELRLEGCTLRAVLLRRVRLRALASQEAHWSGAVLEGCRGVSGDLEQALLDAGARLVHPPAVRALRLLLGSRKLQIVVVVGLVLLVAAVVLLLRSPGLWPTTVLMSRFEAVESRSDLERCEPLLRVAGVLSERASVDSSTRARLLQRSAECQVQLGDVDQAEATLRRYTELAHGDPAEHQAALVVLGRFLLDAEDVDGAEVVLERMKQSSQPELLLDALRFEAVLRRVQGLSATPAHPDDAVDEADAWRSLQQATARTLLELPGLPSYQLEDTPVELLILGAWDQALALMDAVQDPPLDPSERWQLQHVAVDRLVEAERVDLAIALLARLSEGEVLDDLTDVERLAVTARLHLRSGDPTTAFALLDGLPPPGDPRMGIELLLVRAELLSDTGEHAQAAALLVSTSLDPELPFDLLARHGWMLAEARLRGGDEPGAVAALEPVLAAVPDREPAQNQLRELAAWMERLAEPQRVTDMLARVDNPMLTKAGQGQELALTTLRIQARDSAISMDDPTLLSVLERGTPEQVHEAAALLLEGARSEGGLEAAVRALEPHARKLADVRARENLGMLLADAAAGASEHDLALELLDSLDLPDSESVDIRSRAVGLAVSVDLDRGQLEQAIERYQAATVQPEHMEGWVRLNLGRQIIDALQSVGRIDEALAQARVLRQASAGEPELWFEAMSCLVALGDDEGFVAELEAAEVALGPCRARTMAARAWLDQGRTPTEISALEQACSSAAISVEERLSAAAALGQAGRPQAALGLVRSATALDASPELSAQVHRELAGWLAATGDRPAAIALLNDRYDQASEARVHQQLTDALLGHLAAEGEIEPLVGAYLRYTRDHPDAVELHLWKQAALALINAGGADALPRLEGQPGWLRHVSGESRAAELRALLEAGDTAGAWAWLDAALDSATNDDLRTDLLHRAASLADQVGEHTRLLSWLEGLEARIQPSGELYQLLLLRRAKALQATGDSEAAAVVLATALALDLNQQLRGEALDAYGYNLGRVVGTEEIEAALVALAGGATLDASGEQAVRLRAAEQLLSRNEPGAARDLLEPLAGQSLEPARAEACWDLLARAYVAVGRYPDALEIPARFPTRAGRCGAWLAVVRHLPSEGPLAAQARDGALAGCDATQVPLHQALSLADAVGRSDPQRALDFLGQARVAADLGPAEQADIDVERARLLAGADELEQARALLEEVLANAERPGTAARAVGQLLRLVVEQGDAGAAGRVEALAEQGLERVGEDQPAARDITREAVGALRELEAWPAAIAWQQRLVDLHPVADEGRGYALLQLVHTQLAAHPGEPAAAGQAWLANLEEARGLASPGTHLHDELTTLDLAWLVVQAGNEAGILAVLGDDPDLLNAVATRLDSWQQAEAAAVVRRERSRILDE
jgi:uncharacterized protein YjbI with pentapeptide repeats